jgi:hypothetical protein
VTFAACEPWVAARFLLDHGHDAPDPPCLHPSETCPPLKPKETKP